MAERIGGGINKELHHAECCIFVATYHVERRLTLMNSTGSVGKILEKILEYPLCNFFIFACQIKEIIIINGGMIWCASVSLNYFLQAVLRERLRAAEL
jgi:hypothetical protein